MASTTPMRVVSLSELNKNNGSTPTTPLWIAIHNKVYDMTTFKDLHPGGLQPLRDVAGKDATKAFRMFHEDRSVLKKYEAKLCIGYLEGHSHEKEEEKKEMTRQMLLDPSAFGDQIAYGDPSWYQLGAGCSPYYKETHQLFRAEVREFVETHLMAEPTKFIDMKRPPKELLLLMGQKGYLACMAGGPPFPRDLVDPGTPEPKDFDLFHTLILFDEIARTGNAALVAALTNGPGIACSAMKKFGTADEAYSRAVLKEVLMGRKMIALAVSEPQSGSDVAGTRCTMNEVGNEYFVVSGNKKFITNGTYADYFTTLVNDPAGGGLSMIVVPNPVEGLEVRKVNIRGSDLSGTSYLDFNQVRVEKGQIIGQRGEGFKLQMAAFNFERFYVVVAMCRLSRVCIEECIKYVLKREVGANKKLSGLQAIRMRIAEMIRDVEGLAAWIDSIAYQMQHMDYERAQLALGVPMSALKVQASYVYERCARHTTHIFGGNSLVAGGPGARIEPALVQTKAYLIPAGAADVMDDFVARQAIRTSSMLGRL